jgi:homoserine acetyltransferase
MHTLQLDSFTLASGRVLGPVPVAWFQYGPAPGKARRVVVVLHGISASPQALAGGNGAQHFDAGWFDDWLGPGKLFDPRHDCVLAPNTLGSCFGAASPTLLADPSAFPEFTIADAVALHGQWLKALGVAGVDVVVGYSYGGYQAFQWALTPPVPAGRVVALASAPRGNGTLADAQKAFALARRFQEEGGAAAFVAGGLPASAATQSSGFTNGLASVNDTQAAASGEPGSALADWQQVRVKTLTAYGYADWLQAQGCADIPAELAAKARVWAQQFSPWSMAYLRQASALFNVEDALRARRGGVPVLWMVNSGDRLFPATFSAAEQQPAQGGPAATPVFHTRQNLHCITLNGRFGHGSPLLEAELWLPTVREFLAG